MTPNIGLSGIGTALPQECHSLEALASRGLLASTPQALRELGFNRAYVSGPSEDAGELAMRAARAALDDAGVDPGDIDLLVWASARPEGHVRGRPGDRSDVSLLDGFRYSSGWLQEELGLEKAEVLAVAQQGCSTMFSALRAARAILLAEPGRSHALCVGVDVLPAGATREVLYNVISDAACAVVVSRDSACERWVGYRQISRGYYWDPAARGPEIMAAYFPTARLVIEELLADRGLTPDDVDLVIPTGVSRASWDVLLGVVGIPADRLYEGRPSFGHTITADNFIHLQDLRHGNAARPGDRLLLFTYGFGSSWCALLLEH